MQEGVGPSLINRDGQPGLTKEDEWEICAAFGKCRGRVPGLVPAAHSSLILMASAAPSGDTASRWDRSLLLPRSVPMWGPEEGSDFQGKDGDAQQDGGQAGGHPAVLLGAAGGTWLHLSSAGGGLCHSALVIPVLEAAGCSPRGVRLLVGGTIKHCDPTCLQRETVR